MEIRPTLADLAHLVDANGADLEKAYNLKRQAEQLIAQLEPKQQKLFAAYQKAKQETEAELPELKPAPTHQELNELKKQIEEIKAQQPANPVPPATE